MLRNEGGHVWTQILPRVKRQSLWHDNTLKAISSLPERSHKAETLKNRRGNVLR